MGSRRVGIWRLVVWDTGIVGYMLLYTITATILYFQQAEIVDATFTDRAARTVFFARIDLAVNSLTAIIQIFLTGRIVRSIGVALSLATLPLVCVLGFVAFGAAPTLIAIAVFQVLRRTSNYAIARPCREMRGSVRRPRRGSTGRSGGFSGRYPCGRRVRAPRAPAWRM